MNQTKTQHNAGCQRVFKNYDPNCPRCQELMAGAKPRQGWQGNYYRRKKQQDEQRTKAIYSHNCINSGCGPVCTFGDW